MAVLITGAQGFLGAAVLSCLQKEGVAAVGTARRGGDEIVACDLSDPGQILDLLEEVTPSAIVNAAVVADFKAEIGALYAVNVLAPAILAGWCARNASKLVQVSGTLVHGLRHVEIGASTPIAPDSPYGTSKLLADEVCEASGCPLSVVRFGGIFGSRGPAHLGLNRAIRSAMEGEAPTLVATGRARRNYVYVNDAAALISWCVLSGHTGTIYVGGAETLSMAETLQTVCDVLLPGKTPRRVSGKEGADQVVLSSPGIPVGRSFRDALESDLAK